MLQDLTFGRLENEFYIKTPAESDPVICVSGSRILLRRDGDDTLHFPTAAQVGSWSSGWEAWGEDRLRYVFRQQGENYFLWMGRAGACPEEPYRYEEARELRQMVSKEKCFAAMTA